MIAPEAAAMQAHITGHMSADAVIRVLAARCDELLDQIAERDRTISLQLSMIETMSSHPLPKIRPGDLDRLDTILLALRSDPRQIWGACIESLERVMKNVREMGA
jgi:hypothetical protein